MSARVVPWHLLGLCQLFAEGSERVGVWADSGGGLHAMCLLESIRGKARPVQECEGLG